MEKSTEEPMWQSLEKEQKDKEWNRVTVQTAEVREQWRKLEGSDICGRKQVEVKDQSWLAEVSLVFTLQNQQRNAQHSHTQTVIKKWKSDLLRLY